MASTQKKSTGGKRTAPSSSGKRAGASASRSGGSRKAAPAPKPIRREVGAGVCILLSFLTALGCFHVDAWLIDLFCNLLRGLLGYGFWAVPVMLAVAGGILAFHRGRPVRLRVWCALLTPVLFGCLLHLFLASGEALVWGWSLFPELWKSGVAMTSGGAVSGLLAQLCIAGISKYGAGAVFIVGTALLLLAAFNLTVVDVVDYIRSRPHPEYEEEELPEPPRSRRTQRPEPAPQAQSDARRAAIDIPVDDGPLAGDARPQPEEVLTPRKERLFNRKPSVRTPDQVLTGARPMEAPPPAPAAPAEPAVSPEVPDASAPVPAPFAPAPTAPAAPVPDPTPMPEIQREPAVEKVKKSDAAQAAAEVAQEVEKKLEEGRAAYQYPPVSLLLEGGGDVGVGAAKELQANQARLADTIQSFGVEARMVNVVRGPSVTRYEMELEQGVKLNKITNLADDIALALGATGVRIAPIPDKISTVGIEVPNKLVSPVHIHEVIDSKEFRDHPSKVAFAVGKDIGGKLHRGQHRQAAPPAHRRYHRLRQVGVHQLPHHLPALQGHPRGGPPHHGGPQDGGAGHLQRHPPPAHPRGHRPQEGRRRPPVGGDRDDEALPGLFRGGGPGPGLLQRPRRPDRGDGQDAPGGGGHRRAGRPDAGGRQGGGGVHLPGGPDGPRRRNAPHHRHPAALRRRDHRPDEGQHPQPHRLCRGLLAGVPHHSGHHRVRRSWWAGATCSTSPWAPASRSGSRAASSPTRRWPLWWSSSREQSTAEYDEEVHPRDRAARRREGQGRQGRGRLRPRRRGGGVRRAASPPPSRWWWRPAWPPYPCSSGG